MPELTIPLCDEGAALASSKHFKVHPPAENDPLFENLVRCVSRHCRKFVDLHGGEIKDYYIGAAGDAREKLMTFHQVPDDTPYLIRDGLHFDAARTIVQQLIQKGCRGVAYVEAGDDLDLYLYRVVPGVTVEDD
ncbi:hypothetical protein KQI65_07350 [bacterium]|nr:hypothetical protein [bacterium]